MSALARIAQYVLLPTLIVLTSGCKEGPVTDKTYDGNSIDLKHTVIVPTLETPLPSNKNVIWCLSFQIAWNEMKDNIIGRPLQIEGANQICNRLNAAKQTSADIPPDSLYARAGLVKDGIVEKIHHEMEQRFPSVPKAQFDVVTAVDIIAYSYVEAAVRFKIPFFENRGEFIFKDSRGNKSAVTSFGIRSKDEYAYRKLREQVNVLFHTFLGPLKSKDSEMPEFALDLCKYTKPNQIVLARIKPKETLAETLAALEEKIANFPKHEDFRRFGIRDVLLVPNMFWRISHHFDELEGKRVLNPGFQGYWVKEAMQMVQFRLDRSGAELKSEAKLHVTPAPEYFVFDGPFLIYKKKRGAKYPFFAVWVDNPELLSKPQTESIGQPLKN